MTNFDEIWERNMGKTYEITQDDAKFTNGLKPETAELYEKADSLSDDELWAKMEAGEL